jgi:ligand-binding SRPBCC domain-containing protein
MGNYTIKSRQKLPISLKAAWDFFSSPQNLNEITPPSMGFETLSCSDSDKIYAGQIITYYVRPFAGIPLYWMTEITHVQEGIYFVDEQRFGPYALWHHQHHFREIKGGVEITDLVHYKLPLGLLGNIAHALFVKRQLKGIFDFREKVLETKFGKMG